MYGAIYNNSFYIGGNMVKDGICNSSDNAYLKKAAKIVEDNIPNCCAMFNFLSDKPRYDIYIGVTFAGNLVIDEDNEKDVYLIGDSFNSQLLEVLNCEYVFSTTYCKDKYEVYRVQI